MTGEQGIEMCEHGFGRRFCNLCSRAPRRVCDCTIYTGSERLPTGEKVCERCGGLLS